MTSYGTVEYSVNLEACTEAGRSVLKVLDINVGERNTDANNNNIILKEDTIAPPEAEGRGKAPPLELPRSLSMS